MTRAERHAINFKTAKTLRLTIPQSLLLGVDRMIPIYALLAPCFNAAMRRRVGHHGNRAIVSLLLGAALAVPGVAGAVTDGDFEVKTTRSLLNLCTVSAEDARYKEALHFCHGYLVGAFHYYLATISGPSAKPLVCPPDPPPSRNAAFAAFIGWAQAHPQYMNEAPVETEFRFLTETWPCKR